MYRLVFALCMLASTEAFSAAWVKDQTVREVGVKYGNGCLKTDSNIVVKMDLSTDAGRAEYALALTAVASGKTIDFYQTDGSLLSGCDVGTTIKPHLMLKIDK